MFSQQKIQQTLSVLSHPVILFYCLPWFMCLMIVGTIAQKYLGLYIATKTYLTSPIFWLWDIAPLPGLPITVAVIFVNLLCKLLLKSPWSKQTSGIIITHLGACFLFLGMMLTSIFSYEGYITIGEGEYSEQISDYYQREFTIQQDGDTVLSIPYAKLHQDKTITVDKIPFDIQPMHICRNCTMEHYAGEDEARHGLAQKVSLINAPLEKTEETNLSGIMVNIQDSKTDQDGVHIIFEALPKPTSITIDKKTYTLSMQRVQTPLPFQIALVDVQRELYPGMDMAKSYQSEISLKDGDVAWNTHIKMNEPLRYKGYTFYQSGYSLRGDQEYTTLAVVKNMGRSFPYIAGLFISIGMILHSIMRFRNKKKEAANAA